MPRRKNKIVSAYALVGDEMGAFEATALPKDVTVEIEHEIEWARPRSSGEFIYHYNFFSYTFRRGDLKVRARYYWRALREISIGGPFRDGQTEPLLVEDDELMRAVVRYFVEREYKVVKVMEQQGYVRLKPEHPWMQASRA